VGDVPVRETGIEVWQWTRQKYRIRAIVLLLINAALFVGLGCFTFWLRTGEYSPFAIDDYWRCWKEAFSPTRVPPVTLIDFLTFPIPVSQVPLMMVIVGLVLASLTAVPILVSMLYRFPFSLIFTLIICFVAVVPWLAITVTFCCFLARWKPLRFSFHYATALISLLPLAVYYALATRGPAVSSFASPVEMAKFYVPWVLALIVACILMAVVLVIAKLVNYRPGAIAPLMALMFAAPVLLFETLVGRDELYYRLLEVNYGPGSKDHFVDNTDASPIIDRIAGRRWERIKDKDSTATLESVREGVRVLLDFQLSQAQPDLHLEGLLNDAQLASEQYQAVLSCKEFLRRFPKSRYVPNVLYLKGRAIDLRIDQVYFRQTAILRYHQDFPSEASLPAWRELYDLYLDSPLWIVAAHRLALLEARRGHTGEAVKMLEVLFGWYDKYQKEQATGSAPPGWRSFFARRSVPRPLDLNPAGVLLEARKLHSLIVNNGDPQQNNLALRRLLCMNPRHPMYQANLRQMLDDLPGKYPLTPLRDNLQVLVARASAGSSHSRRIELLKDCVAQCAKDPKSDAFPMARFELGLAYKDDRRLEEARKEFEDLSRNSPESPWAQEARQQLAAMGVGKSGF
jgi:hypothetical protein